MESAQKKYKSKFDRKNYDLYQTLTLILTQIRHINLAILQLIDTNFSNQSEQNPFKKMETEVLHI